MPSQYAGETALGQALFGETLLGDERRTKRLVATFERLRRHPGGTLPDKLSSPADLKALYRLCPCEAVTHAVLIAAMRAYTLTRIRRPRRPGAGDPRCHGIGLHLVKIVGRTGGTDRLKASTSWKDARWRCC